MSLMLLRVEWEDSYGVSPGWEPIEENLDPQPLLIKSVGWLVAESAKCLTLVPHMHEADPERGIERQGCGDMTIPKSCIVSRTEL